MPRQVLYVAHHLAPTPEEIAVYAPHEPWRLVSANVMATRANINRALQWLAWLRRSFPDATFIAPWIATAQSLAGDNSPAVREAGLVDGCAVIERCDGLVLCGARISDRMRRELNHARAYATSEAFMVFDLTKRALVEPPGAGTGFDGPCPWPLHAWYGLRDTMRWSEVTP